MIAKYELLPWDGGSEKLKVLLSISERTLLITYQLIETANIALPSRSQVDPDNLWQTTCFELFLQERDSTAYVEFNFSPADLSKRYEFSGYRAIGDKRNNYHGDVDSVEQDNGTLALTAKVTGDFMAIENIGITAIVKDKQGKNWHYAVNPIAGDPDFHRQETFIPFSIK